MGGGLPPTANCQPPTIDYHLPFMPDLIAFDADDTLWHNERIFHATEVQFAQLLAEYHSAEWVGQRLLATETKNLGHFGYGIKGFILSMIETAIELTEGRISGDEIREVIEWGSRYNCWTACARPCSLSPPTSG